MRATKRNCMLRKFTRCSLHYAVVKGHAGISPGPLPARSGARRLIDGRVRPTKIKKTVVEARRLELLTYCLQSSSSPN